MRGRLTFLCEIPWYLHVFFEASNSKPSHTCLFQPVSLLILPFLPPPPPPPVCVCMYVEVLVLLLSDVMFVNYSDIFSSPLHIYHLHKRLVVSV